jgi:hypothetical protein
MIPFLIVKSAIMSRPLRPMPTAGVAVGHAGGAAVVVAHGRVFSPATGVRIEPTKNLPEALGS